ncbi:XtrA/YqaO family protein [Bacillus velezensis]|nr:MULTISPECIES: XtrA/YqaO family protein [Bacillus]MCF6448278.1 XtrA/YqaO family protein [Bacillus sp. MMG021]MCP8611970.1 XtrA/YqaO family protein [Bacillus velezensis]MCQ9138608.1 XtrA/YqaO family protein [Bacillus amyloliquefaciens]MCS3384305.1 XtrA/YqaO family protein [Bacillus velezensis]MCT7287447.1 XtrA/YqaO family protein [Bacillus velezensis]
MAPLPTYRETKIITNHGKVTRVKRDEGYFFYAYCTWLFF